MTSQKILSPFELRFEIEKDESYLKELKVCLQRKRNYLQVLEDKCPHSWEEPVYDPIITEGYTCQGDPPGTMGIDWRGPYHVPRKEQKRWKRTCRTCGKTEYTLLEKLSGTVPVF